jgi:hypothetical protein
MSKIVKCSCGSEKFIRKSIAGIKMVVDKFDNISDEVMWEDYTEYYCEKCNKRFKE